MAEEIKQPRNIGSVLPVNPTRGAGEKKRRPPPKAHTPKRRDQRRDDGSHRVDEYA